MNGDINGADMLPHADAQEKLNGQNESPDKERAQQIALLQQREMGAVRLDLIRAMRTGSNR